MKTRMPVESANLFAEAAYGVDPNAQGANTQAGAAPVATAWNKAVAAVEGDSSGGQAGSDAGGQPMPQEQELPTVAAASLDSQPVVVGKTCSSLDRLSMTMGSLVAWSLQMEEAPDQATTLIDDSSTEPSVLAAAVVVDPNQITASLNKEIDPTVTAIAAGVLDNELTKTPVMIAADDLALGLTSGQPVESVAAVMDTITQLVQPAEGKIMASQTEVSGEQPIPTITETNAVFREGPVANSDGQNVKQAPTEGVQMTGAEKLQSNAQLGTDADLHQTRVPTRSVQKVTPEIPISIPQARDAKGVGVEAHRGEPGQSFAVQDPMRLVKAVRKSATDIADSPATGSTVSSDVDRLQGLRSALAELDADTLIRAQGSRLRVRTNKQMAQRANVSLQMPTESVQVVANAGALDPQSKMPSQSNVKRTFSATSGTEKPGQAVGESAEIKPGVAKPPTPGQAAKGFAPADRASTLSGVQSLGTGVTAAQVSDLDIESDTMTGQHAQVVGQETAEIEADTLRLDEAIEFDIETIEASEVPELPIQDVSQIDIDIDDPAGQVRLDLSRQAEEVAIRLETPQEVLDEYRDMEEEVDAGLAEQGLNLGSFEAQSGSDENDTEKNTKTESKEGRVATDNPELKPVETEGHQGRLLNVIV